MSRIMVVVEFEVKPEHRRQFCADIPQVQQRTCTKGLFLVVGVPDDNIENAVRDCLATGAVAALITGLATGGAAAIEAFKTTLFACLSQKGIDAKDKISVSLDTSSQCGNWH